MIASTASRRHSDRDRATLRRARPAQGVASSPVPFDRRPSRGPIPDPQSAAGPGRRCRARDATSGSRAASPPWPRPAGPPPRRPISKPSRGDHEPASYIRCPRDPLGTRQPTRSTEPLQTSVVAPRGCLTSNSGRTVTRRRFVPAEPPGWQSPPPRRANLHWKHLIQGRAIMFGEGFENCWYEIPGVLGLELSGDLRFRGPRGLRKLRHDCNGRPYVQDRKVVNHESDGRARQGRVMLHRAVMSVVLGRKLSRDEFVCHRDDDRRNNWPQNLYLGDYHSNAADSVRNGGRVRGQRHPFAKLSDEQVREIRSALSRGERVVDLARAYEVHKSTVSRIKHGVRRRSS